MDLSEELLEQAKAIHPEMHFRKGNILELEFSNGSIAGVIAFYAIIHLTQEQVEIAFREIFRVLQPRRRAYVFAAMPAVQKQD